MSIRCGWLQCCLQFTAHCWNKQKRIIGSHRCWTYYQCLSVTLRKLRGLLQCLGIIINWLLMHQFLSLFFPWVYNSFTSPVWRVDLDHLIWLSTADCNYVRHLILVKQSTGWLLSFVMLVSMNILHFREFISQPQNNIDLINKGSIVQPFQINISVPKLIPLKWDARAG